ncbi:hypothetical protein [Bordetella sp. FB-8]|uniref:hypothetical protein n=1 Tax=Bordetella sp. FB-8 TaxID=1159870 RepID=UPI00035DEC86|nr:hypothetical protein [Bordetella sp. FB-8]
MSAATEMQENICARLCGMARTDISRVRLIAAGEDFGAMAETELARRRVLVRVQFIQSLTDTELAAVALGDIDLASLARRVWFGLGST